MRILLAEDDAFLANGLSLVLADSGYSLDNANNGIECDIALATTNYDLLILDLGLPGMDGIEVLKRLRQRGNRLPVLILSARDQVADRVLGLDSGANDYLTKPFAMSELEARIRALLRISWENQKLISIGELTFDAESRNVTIEGEAVDLTPRELSLLELLLKSKGQLVSKERLTDQLSNWDEEVTLNAVDITVHRLRKKLGKFGTRIRTLRRLGYKLD